jgi:hypothetical protein
LLKIYKKYRRPRRKKEWNRRLLNSMSREYGMDELRRFEREAEKLKKELRGKR